MIIRPGVFINDRYEIIDKVGTGGTADVYKAKDHRLNRFVAVKILKAEFSNDKTFLGKFRAEAQSAAGLSHPNVVNVYDVGDEEDMHYIVMELVEGITLKSFIERKGKLDVKEAVGIAIQIAQGMEAAHGNHIVHRDIKPQNIIISREGKVKVTDFGIAKAVTSDTITSNAMGSVHYLSPEQARGGFSDEKSDIYSLGVTMYEMLTGRVPFIGDNTVSVALCHLQEDAVPIRTLEPTVPVSLDRIVQKCMQKKPEHRYLSASALISDLKKSLSNPDGAYVQLYTPDMIADSPTINLSSEDLEQIKQASNDERQKMEDTMDFGAKRSDRRNPVVEKKAEEDDEEDDEEEDVNPKLEKLMSIGGVLAAILIVFIIIFIIAKASGCFGGGTQQKEETTPSPEVTIEATEKAEKKTVPNVVNTKLSDVQSQLEQLGLEVKVTEQSSDTVEAGYIISQDLEEGTTIEDGMVINLVVSTGNNKISVENVVGQDASSAESILSGQGFSVRKEYEYSDTTAEGKVIRTSPAAGTSVAKGETITIYISKGKEDTTVEVPDLRGCTKSEAKKKLEEKGLVLGSVTEEYSDSVAKGKVISQGYSVGSKAEKGTSVSIVISLGAEPKYRYEARISISDNPFNSEDETGVIKLILKQDGKSKTVYEESHSLGDFPLNIGVIEGYSTSTGEIYMYLDGKCVGGPYSVKFTKVAE
ncbi:serine/threonine protein kinase with PASTA sensor(S) [Clostridium sp. CAG:411]|jgi:serine/threonine protein kinase/beta-lactam-binding protein with PASTA domain|nr:Stk1 family PASTA domain-containing Ser/Thr kinase [Lachnospiraceae bacterium]CDE44082.1 serine/threonine protein kinase with PASTA sensor(S) [Clostridium sp. CAG:411]